MQIWFSNGAKELFFDVRCCTFVSFRFLNALFREIRNRRNRVSYAKTSFAKHEISRNKEHFFAKYETRFAWNSREFWTKETRVSTLVACTKGCCFLWGCDMCVLLSHWHGEALKRVVIWVPSSGWLKRNFSGLLGIQGLWCSAILSIVIFESIRELKAWCLN